MSIIINSFGFEPLPVTSAAARTGSAAAPITSISLPEDTAEFSPDARALASIIEGSSFRTARIRAIRAEIAAGAYETQARIDATVARLLDVLA
jgi:anti-sigma28 factor (negative regulator of flagellin synthesis)